jgi:hypothetical protein
MSQPIRRRRTAFGQAYRVDAGVRGAGPLCGNAAAARFAPFPEMAVAGWEFTVPTSSACMALRPGSLAAPSGPGGGAKLREHGLGARD